MKHLNYYRVMSTVVKSRKPHLFYRNGRWWNIPVSNIFTDLKKRPVENIEVAQLDAYALNFCRTRNKELSK